jgi:hypothetical protein
MPEWIWTFGLGQFLSRQRSTRDEARSSPRCRRGDEAELLEHQETVEHQVERDVLAVAEAEHLDVVHAD